MTWFSVNELSKPRMYKICKEICIFCAFFFCGSWNAYLFALQEGKAQPETQSIDAMIYGVDISVVSYESDVISYKAEIDNGKKVSIIEDARCIRFRNSHPVSGKITVFVPKNMKVHSLRIYASDSKVNVEGLVAVYFVVSMCEGSVIVENAMFKCASFSIASSNCNLNGEVTSTADFCFSETQASINLKGKLDDYNFFYPYEETSSLIISDKKITQKDRFNIDKKKRKRMGITQSSSTTNLSFVD